jgi:hypothetical protein
VEYADHTRGWVGESQGFFMVLRESELKAPVALSPSDVKAGEGVEINGVSYWVTDSKTVSCLGGEGELPDPVKTGEKWHSTDLQRSDGCVATLEWNDAAVEGSYRFLRRVWNFGHKLSGAAATAPPKTYGKQAQALRRELHTVLRQVDYDYQRMQYNTVVSGAMKMLNALEDFKATGEPGAQAALREGFGILLRSLYPATPHIAHTLWQQLGYVAAHGDLLDAPEYDGYLTLTAGTELLSVPWHILPRKAAQNLAVAAVRPNWPGGIILMGNVGAADSEFDIFALTGTSKKADPTELPLPGDNFAFIDMRAIGVRYVADAGALQFALSTFGRRATPNYPAGFEVDIDVDRDGVPDFAVYNAEQGGFGATGINLINVVNLATGAGGAFYYADADFNSANMIMTVPLAALGLTPDQQFDFTAIGYDNYYSGNVTDAFDKMTFTPAKPRYAVNGDSSGIVRSLRIQRVDTLTPVGGATASPSQTGFLVMLRREAGTEAQVIVAK